MRRLYCDRCDREINGKIEPWYLVTEPVNSRLVAGSARSYGLCKTCAEIWLCAYRDVDAATRMADGGT